MGRKRYLRLREAEASGKLIISESPICPQCGKPTCCHIHNYVYHPWWEKTKPYIEMMMGLRLKHLR